MVCNTWSGDVTLLRRFAQVADPEMAQIASPAAAAFPVVVQHLLRTSLELRNRYPEGKISKHGLRSATG
jgi:hypothetical protein